MENGNAGGVLLNIMCLLHDDDRIVGKRFLKFYRGLRIINLFHAINEVSFAMDMIKSKLDQTEPTQVY